MDSNQFVARLEVIARIGSYETDLINGTWTGSENFIRIFGLPPKDIYGVGDFENIIDPVDHDRVVEYFGQCIAEKKEFDLTYRCIRPEDGRVIYVHSRSVIEYDELGNATKVLGTMQDVSEQKENELKLVQLNELNRQKNEVLSSVAHDLKNPIASIQGILNLIEFSDTSDYPSLLQIIRNACHNASTIIDELIEIAQLEDKSVELNKVSTDINELVKKSISAFDMKAREKGINLRTTLCNDASAEVHKEKFRRVIDNLLSNAIKFTPEKHSVELITEKKGNSLFLKVKDDGIGIHAEQIPYLFDKFTKAGRPGTKGEHSIGLGLNIAYKIVQLHKAKISVESEEGVGTTFIVEIN